uniref:Ig-like domain-containing protein n=1 Tax=Cyanistes caeruleus TaxID=156563 RepID=A0A8C0U879_CYACU
PPPQVGPSNPVYPPTVEVFQTCGDHGLVELLCLVGGFAPPTLSLTWLVDGIPLVGHAHTEKATPDQAPGTFRVTSRLNVTTAEWREQSISCQVEHAASGSFQEVTARSCSGEEGSSGS